MHTALDALRRAGLASDIEQVLDALWLARVLPSDGVEGVAPAAAPTRTEPVPPPADPPPPAPSPGDLEPLAVVELRRTPASAPLETVHEQRELHAPGAAGPRRAQASGIGAVPALPDAHALSLALKPLSRRRRSTRVFQVDEQATVDQFAATGLLVPQYLPLRERFFDALMLVESGSAEPLWRSTVDELEQLLVRRVGLRSCRRVALEAGGSVAVVRMQANGGAPRAPAQLIEGDAPLVLLISDGTSQAWADGRMAQMLAELGEKAAVAVVQLLPERLWPNTALGRSDARVFSTKAGTTLARTRATWPEWLDEANIPANIDMAAEAGAPRDPAAVPLPVPIAVPVVALHPAAFRAWARALMGMPGAGAQAALVFPASGAAPDEPMPDDDARPLVPREPDQILERARALVPTRVLRTAAYLAAAAPLNLAVIRLVQRAMTPDAGAGDLALLMLSGLLARGADVNRPAAAEVSGDDAVMFEFPDGLRSLLQRSLLRSEALQIRREVSRYIADRIGFPPDLAVLVESPEGDSSLPSWARPFAEIGREIDQLFDSTSGDDADEDDDLVEYHHEPARARGVTLRATLPHLPGAKTLSYAPDGTRLAVRCLAGVVTFDLREDAGLATQPEPVPTALLAVPQLVVVKGWGMDELTMESAIAGMRLTLSSAFDRPCNLRFHTPHQPPSGVPGAVARSEIRQLLALVLETRSMLCVIGSADFIASPWTQLLLSERASHAGLDPVITLQQGDLDRSAAGRSVWLLSSARSGPRPRLHMPATAAGAELARLIQINFEATTSDALLLGPLTHGLTWWPPTSFANPRHVIVLADEGELRTGIAGVMAPGIPTLREICARHRASEVVAHPGAPLVALTTATKVQLWRWGGAKWDMFGDLPRKPGDVVAWSRTDPFLVIVSAGGLTTLHVETDVQTHWSSGASGQTVRWSNVGSQLCVASAIPGTLQILRLSESGLQVRAKKAFRASVLACAWSHDDRYIACATADGLLQILDANDLEADPPAIWHFPVGTDDGVSPLSVALAFSPRTLDHDFLELAFGYGSNVDLLRLDPRQWAAGARAASVSNARREVGLQPARYVLQALALQYHVGGILPDKDRSRDDTIAIAAGHDEDGQEAMRHWLQMSEYVFWGPVRELLLTGVDPINAGTPESWRETGQELLNKVQLAFPESNGWWTPSSHALLLEVAIDAWCHRDPATFEQFCGVTRADFLRGSRARALERRDAVAYPRGNTDADCKAMLAWLVVVAKLDPESEAAVHVGRHARAFHGTFTNAGPCGLSRAADYLSYLGLLLDFWRMTSERLFAADRQPSLDGDIEIRFPIAIAHLDHVVASLLLPNEIRYMPGDDSDQVLSWSMSRRTYLALILRLGEVVLDGVRQRLSSPPRGLSVLWVGDGEVLESSRYRIERHGVNIEHASTGDAARERLSWGTTSASVDMPMGPSIDAVLLACTLQMDPISTLIEAEGFANFGRPVIVYLTDSRIELGGGIKGGTARVVRDLDEAMDVLMDQALASFA